MKAILAAALSATCLLSVRAEPVAARPAAPEAGRPSTSPGRTADGQASIRPEASTPPRLIVALSVDQFSADLFAEYRNRFTGGFARLLDGAVFPSGYQSHAATETCPGHSTLMTGMRPAHTGIVLNTWYDWRTPLADKVVYCVEDEANPANTHDRYTVAPTHLLVPTLGERMKAAFPGARDVAVSGKDRAAVTMGGGKADETWWWDGRGFASYPGRTMPPAVTRANAVSAARVAEAQPALDLPAWCGSRDRAIATAGPTVGAGRFARAAGNASAFRASPELDGATLAVAAALVGDLRLGRGTAPDVLNVSLSATDYVGHAYGTQGAEMCTQLASLDRDLGDFFRRLDASGVDYALMLSADHGGIDLPERGDEQATTSRRRAFDAAAVLARATTAAGVPAGAIRFQESNVYVDPALSPARRARAIAAARTAIAAEPDVEAVFTADEIERSPEPAGPPETWPLVMRAKASFYRPRSGDLIVAFRPRVTEGAPTAGHVAGHGSFWDYDRRVPILFWRKGMVPFEQPLSVETVDIAPTLAGLMRLPLTGPRMDGRCLDLDAGPGTTCPIP